MNDLISRQAVKDIMFNHRGVDIYKNNDKKTKRYATIDLDDFDAIPSEEPQRKLINTTEEYENAIWSILKSGRGYKAIIDLIKCMENMHENTITCMKEMQSEKRAIRKICEGPTSNKDKINTILTMYK